MARLFTTLRRKRLREEYSSRRMSLITSRLSSAERVSLPEARSLSMKVCWIAKRLSASLTWSPLWRNCSASFDIPLPPDLSFAKPGNDSTGANVPFRGQMIGAIDRAATVAKVSRPFTAFRRPNC
jgi:hypothetical protein